MWIFEKEKAKLDISKVNSKFQKINRDGFTLIYPKRNVWDWDEEERFLRSVIIDKNGYVVSCGWNKFGNYGEFQNDLKELENSFDKNLPIRFTNKEDGTLCIRSVFNDQVVLRTRGTMFGEKPDDNPFKDRFFGVAENKYPILLDKNWMTDRSLLFEYVSPENRIVVGYKEEDLIFIGSVSNDLKLSNWSQLEQISKEGKLNIVKLYKLNNNKPIELISEVKDWKEEGIVVRCNNDQTLMKFKSAYYLTQHRLKHSISYDFLVDFMNISNIKNKDELIKELKSYDYDFEIIESIIPFYEKYERVVKEVNDCINKAKDILSTFTTNKIIEKERRKELALYIKNEKKHIKTFIFNLYDNNIDKTNNLKRKIIKDPRSYLNG